MVEVLKEQEEPFQKKIVVDIEPDRVAQDLANLAICIHLTEELARLSFHTESLKKLLSKGGVIGQKINFLLQEFNGRANTRCSKSQNISFTSIALDLKVVIDQMREQIQNVG